MLRINCPYCGLRDHEEFGYFGDATKKYPALDASIQDWSEAIYTRNNPRGEHREFWQHLMGCRRWLVVTRNTVTHDMLSVVPAHERNTENTA